MVGLRDFFSGNTSGASGEVQLPPKWWTLPASQMSWSDLAPNRQPMVAPSMLEVAPARPKEPARLPDFLHDQYPQLFDSTDSPVDPFTSVAARMPCNDAWAACLKAGRPITTCWSAFQNCGRGVDTIFAPGIWGTPRS